MFRKIKKMIGKFSRGLVGKTLIAAGALVVVGNSGCAVENVYLPRFNRETGTMDYCNKGINTIGFTPEARKRCLKNSIESSQRVEQRKKEKYHRQGASRARSKASRVRSKNRDSDTSLEELRNQAVVSGAIAPFVPNSYVGVALRALSQLDALEYQEKLHEKYRPEIHIHVDGDEQEQRKLKYIVPEPAL